MSLTNRSVLYILELIFKSLFYLLMIKKTNMQKAIIASGYFNPIHSGHIQYLEAAKKLGDFLIVVVNNDWQVRQKGRIPFMSERERMKIVSALRCVDQVILSVDDGGSVCETIKMLMKKRGNYIFAKGGDSRCWNTPEFSLCGVLGIEVVFGVGGDKIQSSSNLLRNDIKKT